MRIRTALPLEIGGTQAPTGTPLDLPDADAEALIAAGRAEPDAEAGLDPADPFAEPSADTHEEA